MDEFFKVFSENERGSSDHIFFFSSRRRHTRLQGDWSSDVCSSDLRVDPGLAANRAVDLSQQGRRYLDEIDPAQQCRRSKTGNIADDAATEGDEHRSALDRKSVV